MNNTKRITYCAMLAAGGLILSWVEHMIPFDFGIPGIKLGLANVATLIALYLYGTRYAVAVSLVRIVLSGLLFGGVFSMAYGIAGGVMSLLGMALIKKTDRFSIVGTSVSGGVLHNFGQILVAWAVFGTRHIFLYLPILALTGTLTGVLIGVVAQIAVKRLNFGSDQPKN